MFDIYTEIFHNAVEQMSLIPFIAANSINDRFLDLLHENDITPPMKSSLEGELLSVAELLEVTKRPTDYSSAKQSATLRAASGMHDLAAKVLSAAPLSDFEGFLPHLRLISEDASLKASLGQNASSGPADDTARKIAELYMACLAVHVGFDVKLDSPTAARGDNPDVLFRTCTTEQVSRHWALAIKTISSRQGQTIFERIADGARQINRDACPSDVGMVVINTKSALDHDALWNASFKTELEACEAMTDQVGALIAAAEKDRDPSDWSSVFTGRTVAPVLFLAQSLITLPTPFGKKTPTALKMLIAHDFGHAMDHEALSLASTLNHLMQTILLGQPGGIGFLPR